MKIKKIYKENGNIRKMEIKRFDLHTHTILSDGTSSVDEMAKKAEELNNSIAITDHILNSNLKNFLDAREKYLKIYDNIIFGVEITRVNPEKIPEIAKEAKKNLFLVIVHGETPGDIMVPKNTNKAALNCKYVDILAHPGNLTEEDAQKAKENEIYIELGTRSLHTANGSINKKNAKICRDYGVKMVINTDAHSVDSLISYSKAVKVALDAGLTEQETFETNENARKIFEKYRKG